MRTRQLAGRPIAAVGLGDVSLERSSKRGRDPAETIRRVHEALEAEIDLIDVAPEDDSERAVGEAVRALRLRDRAIVATRVVAVSERDTVQDRLPRRYIVERVDASLRATKLDALPLVQLPLRASWLVTSAWPELVGNCARLVREGKVMSWGVRVSETSADPVPAVPKRVTIAEVTAKLAQEAERPRSSLILMPDEAIAADPALAIAVELTRKAGGALPPVADGALTHPAMLFLDEPWLASLAIEVSMCRRDAIALCAAAAGKKPVLALHPLEGGALAGTLGPGASLAPLDDRRAVTPEQLEAIAVGVAKLASRVKREPLSARSCAEARTITDAAQRPPNVMVTTLAELALRYVIDRGAIAMPRIHTRDALAELVACGNADALPEALIAKIDELLADPTGEN
ncbi:MAG TPA: aldo/keto reductase [Kofleriaceae bacterium]|nr:aldo/keto reductase [Kofleriaceae bacterium]